MTQLLFDATVKFRLRYSVTILTIGPQIGQKVRALLNVCRLITH